jgi:elongation factor Tu
MVIIKPGSVKPHCFKAEVYILKKEGGRHTPFHNNQIHSFLRTYNWRDYYLPEGVEMVMPGDNLTINVALLSPMQWM